MTNLETHMYDWLFHYNPYTELWRAARRESYPLLFSDSQDPSIITSSSISTLIDLINRTDGQPDKLSQLTDNR